MCGPQSKQEMNMIRHATHRLRDDIQGACGATEIGMESIPPFRINEWSLMFGAEDDVEMEAEMGG